MSYKFLVLLVFGSVHCLAIEWPNHDISTLKLLQVVHRHGDRTPRLFVPNDPYKDESHWPVGINELTLKGRYRMFRVGEFIRQHYGAYLGDERAPSEVYARSSSSRRCVESLATLLAGAYPPSQQSDWSNAIPNGEISLGHSWQAVPFETFIPNVNDTLLVLDKICPNVDREYDKIINSLYYRDFFDDHRDLLKNLSEIAGSPMSTTEDVWEFYQTLAIEMDHGYWWDKVWTHQEQQDIVNQLKVISDFHYSNLYNSSLIQKVRSGFLVQELFANMRDAIIGTPRYKIDIYSGHDKTLASLMQLLDVFNNQIVPFGSALFFELHQRNSSFFVKIYYFNETLEKSPFLLPQPKCRNLQECPLKELFAATNEFIITDFDADCGIEIPTDYLVTIFMIILLVLVGIFFGILCSCIYFCITAKNKRNSDEKEALTGHRYKTYV